MLGCAERIQQFRGRDLIPIGCGAWTTHLNGSEDAAYIALHFPDKVVAHLNVNSLLPVKVRTTQIGGEKKMLIWNDLEAATRASMSPVGKGVHNLLVNCRSGDMCAPKLDGNHAPRAILWPGLALALFGCWKLPPPHLSNVERSSIFESLGWYEATRE